ncbi:DUF1501 domain-containing protein [Amorphoplanes nipponensis]|uniref:DUF1501 domain-containing protein n=1 Tax=Actinoplanes nipponensis TaxID=135950 RepID=A0A919JGF6_9ACTN|nr:DUF1501 domain-containing protein [Actinoplanes nipponensis]GIE48840.1 hypothetical protein Ani05nite_23740 [Actinoplanes nipponensis]
MDTITRRRFLTASGVVAAGALAAGGTAYGLRDVLATAGRREPGRILVLVTLYGGNDGLNTVIPYADPAYAAARPGLAYDEGQVLALADGFGLNPGLKGLHHLYGRRRLAVVRGVGYPRPDRSHFRSMDIWQTAAPERPGTTGWLGRWLDTAGRDPRLAISFEPVLPPLLAGATCAGATVPGGALTLPRGVTTPVLGGFGAPAAGESPAQARAAACFADLVRVQGLLTEVGAGDDEDGEDAGGATATGGQAPPLDRQLALVARCVEAGAATRVYSVSLGGFDLHADEKTAQEALLTKLDRPLAAFAERMAGSEAGRDVVVAVYSEFGRRVRANASDGTDHGTASNVLLLGAGIPGGLYGEPPSLTDLDDGDLRHTVDFRDVYAMLLADVLGADPEPLLDGWTGRLTFS